MIGDKILLVKTEIASPAKARSIEGIGTSLDIFSKVFIEHFKKKRIDLNM